jgi:hypothetical protein
MIVFIVFATKHTNFKVKGLKLKTVWLSLEPSDP